MLSKIFINCFSLQFKSLPGFMIFKNGREIKHRGKMDYESLLLFVWETLRLVFHNFAYPKKLLQ